MSWRDRQILRAFALLNSTAIDVRNSYETLLNKASFLDSAWDPAGFANHRIDGIFRHKLQPEIAVFFREAGEELCAIDDRLLKLGAIFSEEPQVKFPDASTPSATKESPPKFAEAAGDTNHPPERWHTAVGKAVAETAWAISGYASEKVDWLVQDKVGLRNRLRWAAAERIATIWMGDVGNPTPVLSQIISMIDVAANEARVTTP